MIKVRRYATGGMVEEEVPSPTSNLQPMPAPAPTAAINETVMSKQAPPEAPVTSPGKKAPDQLSAAIKDGIMGLSEQRQREQGSRSAVPTGSARLPTAPKEPLSFTKAEYEAIVKKIDPEGKLPAHLKDQFVLQKGYEFFLKKGDAENAKKWATNAIRQSQMMASLYGRASVDAAKEGKFEEATKLLFEGYNNHVPDGQVMDVKLGGNAGMAIFRNSKTGEVYGDAQFTPQNVMAMAAGLASGQAFYKAMLDAAAGQPKGTGQGIEAKAPVDPEALTTMKTGDVKVRSDVVGQLDGDKDNAGVLDGVLLQAAGITPGEDEDPKAAVNKHFKPQIRTAARDVATDLVLHSQGAVSADMAAQRVAEMLSVDPDDPTRMPFMARVLKKSKRIEVKTLDGEIMSLPMSALPRIKTLIKWQQARASDLVSEKEIAAAAAAAHEKAGQKRDKQNAQADAEIGGGFSGMMDGAAKATASYFRPSQQGR